MITLDMTCNIVVRICEMWPQKEIGESKFA